MATVNEKKESSNNFLAEAGILAMAGIISRVIGLLYRSPLALAIGDLGLGYYQSAYSYYMLILLISSYSIPAAISKIIAQKLGVGEYKNAHRMFWGAMIYVLIVGAAASLVLFFGAGLFVEDTAIPVLRTFAPTIFIYGMLGVLRGYFQADGNMKPTSLSQILEQIANAVVSVGAAVLLIRLVMGTMEVPADTAGQVKRAIYGAMGSALGTGSGVVVALIFMIFVYFRHRAQIMARVHGDLHTNVDSYGMIAKQITFIVFPFILNTAIGNLCNPVNTKIFTDIYPTMKNLDIVQNATNWGILSGKSITISNIPVAFSSAMAAAMIPSISQLMASGNRKSCVEKIGLAVKTTMIISIPCAVGLFVYSAPVTLLLFPNSAENIQLASYTLKVLAPSVIFFALCTLNSSILQGLGRVSTPIVTAGIALIIQTILSVVLLFTTTLDVYTIALANSVYSGIMAFMNQHYVKKEVGYRLTLSDNFVKPFFASVVMGVLSYVVYYLLLNVTNSPRIAVIPAIVAAVPIYFVTLVVAGGITEEELRSIPKGYVLVRILKKCHLMK